MLTIRLALMVLMCCAHLVYAAEGDSQVDRAGADAQSAAYWAVVSSPSPDGAVSLAIVGLSKSSTSAPEFRALQDAANVSYEAAKEAWDERRKAYEADSNNRKGSFRKVEPEPAKPAVKILGSAQKDRAKAEEILAKMEQELLTRNNPGSARRKQVMTEQLLQYFNIGIQASPEWIMETRTQQGARWACLAGYLSHVVDTPNDVEGKDVWFFKYGALRNKFEGCRRAKVICWNTWYGLAEAPPARYQPNPPAATVVNAKVQSTMIAYWSMVKKHMQMAKEFEDVDCVLQIEPDEWGHLLLSCGFDGEKEGVILVGGSGMPELKGIPDSVKGFARAFRVLRDLYAPHVLLAANPSAWDRNGSMTGENWGKYFNTMDVNVENGWDLFITQLHDWDTGQSSNGAKAKYPPYKDADIIDYFGSIDNWCAWIKPIHDATGMWCVAWQLPQGNSTYATCDGTDGHAMDGVTELLLDKHPENRVAARMAASGCCMWIYSLGGGGSTVDDSKKDGITNPSPYPGNKGKRSIYPDDDGGYLRLMGGEYFKTPAPILGKPISLAKGKSKGSSKSSGDDGDASESAASARSKPEPAPKLTDPQLRAVWIERLRTTLLAEIDAGREPHFVLSLLGTEATVRGMSDNGSMAMDIAGSGEMTVSWNVLSDRDRAALAVALARRNDPSIQALAAFFLILSGDTTEGRERLGKAQDRADEVKAAFALDGE